MPPRSSQSRGARDEGAIKGFIDFLPMALLEVDSSGRVTLVNDYAARLLALDEGDLLGVALLNQFRAQLEASKRRASGADPLPACVRVQTPTTTPWGDRRLVAWDVAPSETPGRLVASGIDVTEYRASGERLRAFMDSATDGFFLFDADLRLIDLNRSALLGFPEGTTRDELIGRSITELFPDLESTQRLEGYVSTLKTGAPYHTEPYQTNRWGKRRWYESVAFSVGDGLGIRTTEITKQRQTEQRLRAFMDSATDHFLIFDSELRVVDANTNLARFYDKRKEDIIGLKVGEITPGIEETPRYKAYLDVVREGRAHTIRNVTFPVHPERAFDLHLFKVGDGVGLVSRDVTERVAMEHMLKEGEEKLRAFLDSSTDMFILMDGDLNLLDANAAFLRHQPTHIRKEDVVGRNLAELSLGLSESGRIKSYKRVLETGEPYNTGTIWTTLGGGIWVEVIAFRVGDNIGARATDVTKRVLAERRLAEAEGRYRAGLEVLHRHARRLSDERSLDGVVEATLDILKNALRYEYVGFLLREGEYLHVSGTKGGVAPAEMVPLSGRGIVVRAFKTGESQIVPDTSKDPDYTPSPIRSRSELAVPVVSDGRPVGVLNVESHRLRRFGDADRRLVEILSMHVASALRNIDFIGRLGESEARYREIVENSLLGVVISVGERVVFTNSRMAEMLGYDAPGDLLGRDVKEFIHPNDRAPISQFLQRGGDTPEETYMFRVLTRGSDVRNLQASTTPITFEGQRASLVFVTDITEVFHLQNMLETETLKLHEAQKLDAMKSRFISTATHELKTPLTSVIGYLELLMDRSDEFKPDTLQMLQVIRRNADRLHQLSSDLLDLQRLEAGNLTLTKERVAIREILDETASEIRPLIEEKSQSMTLDSPGGASVVEVNRMKIGQVLFNLISNASKFSPPGSEIRVLIEDRGDEVAVSVTDSGIGIRADDIPKLFKPFPDIPKKSYVAGTGLGLSICKGLVELHRGRIHAESGGEGKGSTFTFTLPKAD